MGPVGAEVTEVGHVGQLVVDHRRPLNVPVDEERAGFCGAVRVDQMHIEERFDE